MFKILLVEDQALIVKSLTLSLGKKYDLLCASSLKEAYEIDLGPVDLALLDISLPDGSGMDYFLDMKNYKEIPVIFLTANDEEETIVKAFHLGAEDYITKPFRTGELIARIERLLPEEVFFEDIRVDLKTREVLQENESIDLTAREFDLLVYFLQHKNQVVTRDQLLQQWELEDKFVTDNTLTVYIKRLREKLDLPGLKTIKNVGYQLYEKA